MAEGAVVEQGLETAVEAGNTEEAYVDVAVVVVGSLHQNQPGVSHVDVVELLAIEEVLSAVVVLSRQPHQPGVWHVAVRVLLMEVLVEADMVGSDEGSETLPSKYFQL